MMAAGDRAADPRGPAMILRGFLCQNLAVGLAFGSFGVALLPLQERFGIGRGMASLGIALAVMTMGLAAPLLATVIARIGMRATMMGGIVLSACGYVMLALAPNVGVVLLAYAGPIGLGLVGFGPLPSTVLAGNWYRANPGPAIGLVNMPLMMVLVPLASVPLIRELGLTGLYLAFAGLHVLLLPLAWGVVASPDGAAAGATPLAGHGVAAGAAHPGTIPASAILGSPVFWCAAVGSGVLHAVGIIASAQLVALGLERGLGAEQAASLISVMGVASIVGAFGAGLLCARIGGGKALVLIALGTGAGWLMLWGAHSLVLMAAVTLLIGAGGSAVFPAMGVLASEKFGPDAVSRVLGLFGLATLPFNFGLPPLAGVLHDSAGSYDPVLATIVLACAVVALLYLMISRWPARTVLAV